MAERDDDARPPHQLLRLVRTSAFPLTHAWRRKCWPRAASSCGRRRCASRPASSARRSPTRSAGELPGAGDRWHLDEGVPRTRRQRCQCGAAQEMRGGSSSESEPLMTCRKRMDDVETGGKSLTRDESGGWPDCCPDGIRHEGGVTQSRLLCGTWEPVAPMRREKSKWAGPTRMRVPMRGTGAEQPVVGMKAL